MTDPTIKPVRISPYQSNTTRAIQAVMIAATELELITALGPYQVGEPVQRESVLTWLRTRYNMTIPLTQTRGLVFPILVDGTPVVLTEDNALPALTMLALVKLGLDGARRLSHRPDMLPVPLS